MLILIWFKIAWDIFSLPICNNHLPTYLIDKKGKNGMNFLHINLMPTQSLSSGRRGPYRFIILIFSIRYVYAEDRLMWRALWYDSNSNKGDSTLLALLIEFCFTVCFAKRGPFLNENHHKTSNKYQTKKLGKWDNELNCIFIFIYK